MMNEADIALGPLGAHRTGLVEASPLRNRDFLANGIPWVTSTPDIGLSDLWPDWMLELPADESLVGPDVLVAWFDGLDLVRAHAEMSEMHKRLDPRQFVAHLRGVLDGRHKDRRAPEPWPNDSARLVR
jgi:hypothetical protein